MVAVGDGQVVRDQLEIEIPRPVRCFALFQPLRRARRHRDWRQSRRAAQALLGTTVGDIDSGLVDFHRHRAQRGHAIGDDQRSDCVCGFADGFAALERSGRGFRLHVHDDLRLLAANEFRRFLVAEDFAPRFLEAHQFCALTACHFRHAIAEKSVGKRHHLRSRLNEVGDCGFHTAASRGGDHKRQLVPGSKDLAQHPLDIGGNLEEVSVEMADDRLCQRLIDSRMHLAGSGPEQQPFRGMNGNLFHDGRLF